MTERILLWPKPFLQNLKNHSIRFSCLPVRSSPKEQKLAHFTCFLFLYSFIIFSRLFIVLYKTKLFNAIKTVIDPLYSVIHFSNFIPSYLYLKVLRT